MNSTPSIPDSIRVLMAEIGPRWAQDTAGHSRLMMERFTALLADAPKGAVSVRRDLAYGSHPRQQLDLFMPDNGAGPRPALLFVHGGAFTEGQRNRTSEVYANVLYYFARHGIVGANVSYRLAPEARYPQGSLDIGAAVAWVRERTAELDIDPGRIFLMGHSAGGAHVASYAYDRRLQPEGGSGLAGLIVVSGRVRADNLPENPNARRVETYYGADPSHYDEYSALACAGADSVPTLIAFSEYENPLLDVYCLELAWRLAAARRRSPQIVFLPGHNHASIIAHFNTAEDRLGRAILDFIAHPR